MAYKRNKKEFFFPSVYMKMNWTFNYLKVMGRIQPIFWNKESKRKKKKKERKKEMAIVNEGNKKVVLNYIKTEIIS